MPDVRVSVNEQVYTIACGDGEEDRVESLARYLDHHVHRLADSVGKCADSRLLLMAALTICDELFVAREQLASTAAAAHTPAHTNGPMSGSTSEPEIAKALNDAADRIERVTQALGASEDERAR